MQLSSRGRYAVMAMTDLARAEAQVEARSGAFHSPASQAPVPRAVSLAVIAERQEISRPYLEQLFARLRRRGLVTSVRGPGGGYRLGRPAGEVSVAEVVLAVDEPLRATRCEGAGTGCMRRGARCLTHDLWDETGRRIHDYLASVSLADVLAGRLSPPPSAAGSPSGQARAA